LRDSFQFVFAGNSTFSADSPGLGSGRTISSMAGDYYTGAALSSNTTVARIFSSSSPTNGWGFTLRVPAHTTSRTLIVRFSQFSCVVECRAHMSDGSIADVTVSRDSGSGATLDSKITVTFNTSGNAGNAELVFTAKVTSRYTADPNISFGSATLA